MSVKLAINGGNPVRTIPFKSQICLRDDDIKAVERVLRSGKLSSYRANKEGKYGGDEIKKLCQAWAERFEVEYVIPTTSCTMGLFACLKTMSVIHIASVTPYSMTCSMSLPYKMAKVMMTVNDVDAQYFQMANDGMSYDVSIPVSLFGQPLMRGYKAHRLIEDSAQCVSKQVYSTDLRVHSFTEGKHMTCGEGGLISTSSEGLFEQLTYIINHAESVINDEGYSWPTVGYNLRMTEIHAALINSQLKRLDENIRIRRENVGYLNERLGEIPGIRPGKADEIGSHSYYCAPYHFTRGDIHRDKFLEMVRAELGNCRINGGYTKPLYRFPFYDKDLNLPVVERMWKDELFLIMDIAYPHTLDDMRDIADAFEKVANEL